MIPRQKEIDRQNWVYYEMKKDWLRIDMDRAQTYIRPQLLYNYSQSCSKAISSELPRIGKEHGAPPFDPARPCSFSLSWLFSLPQVYRSPPLG
jgi:hypothetical protein